MLPYEHLEILLWFMITNLSIIKFFFLIVLFNFSKVTALTPPVAEARPEIKIEKYQDVFAQIKKQNWVMAITLADDSNKSMAHAIVTKPVVLAIELAPSKPLSTISQIT